MTITTITSNNIGSGLRFTNDIRDSDYVVATGVTVQSTGTSAFVLRNSDHDVSVRGTVSAASWAVSLGDDYTLDGGHSVTIARGGSLVAHDGIRLMGQAEVSNAGTIDATYMGLYAQLGGTGTTRVVNDGLIRGGHDGIFAENYGATSTEILNRGTVEGGSYGVRLGGGTASVARLTNDGTISGTVYSVYCGSEADRLVNRGQLRGDVWLGAGDDLFDNRGGSLRGKVMGYSGDDRFCPGAGAENFDGGVGRDTIDFRSGSGVQVSLTKGTGTGAARSDAFKGFEVLLGSLQGADVLEGDDLANSLHGAGGRDTLRGLGGNDVLVGGLGADRLTGGTGDDAFVFASRGQAGDTISDFRNATGNNDRFEISAAGFGGGLAIGTLSAGRFLARADNHAQDGNDRFIFRTTDRTLWFDADGTGQAGPVLLADLQASATLASHDILLI